MKTDKKRRLAKIIILVSGLWSLVSLCYGLDLDFGDIPLPPQSNFIWKNRWIEINGVKTKADHFESLLSPQEIANFYQDTLKDWQLAGDYYQSHILYFTKENSHLYIASQGDLENRGASEGIIIRSPQELVICRAFVDGNLNKDVSGSDFKDIPRYPGSYRMLSISGDEEGSVIAYNSSDPVERISSFYRSLLKISGWKPLEELEPGFIKTLEKIRNPDSSLLVFERDGESLIINIVKAQNNQALIIITRNLAEAFIKE